MKKHRSGKSSYLIAENNDPTGYKSGKACAMKKSLNIKAIFWPRYSPDLMHVDFTLWNDINRRMGKHAPVCLESAVAFKAHLRRMALRISTKTVRKAVEAMRTTAKQIWKAKGKNIARD